MNTNTNMKYRYKYRRRSKKICAPTAASATAAAAGEITGTHSRGEASKLSCPSGTTQPTHFLYVRPATLCMNTYANTDTNTNKTQIQIQIQALYAWIHRNTDTNKNKKQMHIFVYIQLQAQQTHFSPLCTNTQSSHMCTVFNDTLLHFTDQSKAELLPGSIK